MIPQFFLTCIQHHNMNFTYFATCLSSSSLFFCRWCECRCRRARGPGGRAGRGRQRLRAAAGPGGGGGGRQKHGRPAGQTRAAQQQVEASQAGRSGGGGRGRQQPQLRDLRCHYRPSRLATFSSLSCMPYKSRPCPNCCKSALSSLSFGKWNPPPP